MVEIEQKVNLCIKYLEIPLDNYIDKLTAAIKAEGHNVGSILLDSRYDEMNDKIVARLKGYYY